MHVFQGQRSFTTFEGGGTTAVFGVSFLEGKFWFLVLDPNSGHYVVPTLCARCARGPLPFLHQLHTRREFCCVGRIWGTQRTFGALFVLQGILLCCKEGR